ncbi:hypothetical protein ACSMX9_12405 [Streptomyces sp. LE64]|uniref:hypothetical protein n=1 Tax=Streptomyces sp. LE64 TaxID=3448653 RepID=UPI00404144F4
MSRTQVRPPAGAHRARVEPAGPPEPPGPDRAPGGWSERELRLVERLAVVHERLAGLHEERAALVAYVSRLHAGRIGPPDATGGRTVHVDTAVGRLSWRIAADEAELLAEDGSGARGGAEGHGRPTTARESRRDTVTRLAFLHLHRRPNRPVRLKKADVPGADVAPAPPG